MAFAQTMIGRPEWFKPRRYTGVGLMPKTWQGWAYLLVFLLIILFIQLDPLFHLSSTVRTILTFGTVILLLVDTTHITIQMRKGR